MSPSSMSPPLLALVVLASCQPPTPGEGAGPELKLTAGLPVSPVSAAALYRWALVDDWQVAGISWVGDQNGDAERDVLVDMVRLSDGVLEERKSVVVYGPLARDLQLPGDEDAEFDYPGAYPIGGDATGDGVDDVGMLLEPYFPERKGLTVVPGPFSGLVDVLAVGFDTLGCGVDLDGDGLCEQVLTSDPEGPTPNALEITWGPVDRWTGAPDVILNPSCDTSGDMFSNRTQSYPDVTGDGIRELWLEGGGYPGDGCANLVLPLPDTGTSDPATAAGVGSDIWPFSVVPDQTGDGAPDVLLSGNATVLASPVTFGQGSIESALRIERDPDVKLLASLPYDLSGDGVADFLGFDYEVLEGYVADLDPVRPYSGLVMIVVEGGTLSAANATLGWDLESGSVFAHLPFVQDGRGFLLANAAADGDILLLDLGPATEAP